MLTCYLTRRKLGAYLDGALGEVAARSTAAHLATCGVCRAEADELRRLHRLMAGARTVPDPDWAGFWPGVVRGIEDARHHRPDRTAPRWRRYQWAFGGAIAAGLLLSVGLWQTAPVGPAPETGVLVNSASTGDPRATVMVYGTPERDVAVVWILGLDGE